MPAAAQVEQPAAVPGARDDGQPAAVVPPVAGQEDGQPAAGVPAAPPQVEDEQLAVAPEFTDQDRQAMLAGKELHLQQVADTIAAASEQLKIVAVETEQLSSTIVEIRGWVKPAIGHDDTPASYREMLDGLDEFAIERQEFVHRISDAAHLSHDLVVTTGNLLDQIRKRYCSGGSALDKWNAKNYERQLAQIDDLVSELTPLFEGLVQMNHDGPARLRVAQRAAALDRELLTHDNREELLAALQLSQQFESDKRDEHLRLAAKKAELDVAVAAAEHLAARLQEEATREKGLQAELKKVAAREASVKESKGASLEEQRRALRQRREDTDRQRRELTKKREADLRAQEANSAAGLKAVEAELRKLEGKLLQTRQEVVNHVIILIDISGSMSCGQRWPALLQALDAFFSVLVQQSRNDKVSVVCFNSRAFQLLTAADVGTDVVALLRQRVTPSGGTSYVPAWEQAAKCALMGPAGGRLFVLFITDGEAADIPQAGRAAAALWQSRQGHAGMFTAVVNIDHSVPDAMLEPLVKAGNGGKTGMQTGGGAVAPLLIGVRAADMVAKLQQVATFGYNEREDLKVLIGLAGEQVRQVRQSQAQGERDTDALYEGRLKSLDAQARALDLAVTEGGGDAEERVFQMQLSSLQMEKAELETIIENSRARQLTLKECLGRESRKAEELRKDLEDAAPSDEKQLKIMSEIRSKTVESMGKCASRASQQLERSGTMDAAAIGQRVHGLRVLQAQYGQHRLLVQHAKNVVGSLKRFTRGITSSIRDPLPDLEGSIASKADFVFGLLLRERGIPLPAKPAGPSAAFASYLEHEAREMRIQPDDVKEVVLSIIRSNINAEDLCSGCGEDDAEAKKSDLSRRLGDFLLEQAGISGKPVREKDLKEKRKELADKKKKAADLQSKIDRSIDEDNLDQLERELAELEQASEQLEEEVEEMKEKLESRAQATKDNSQVLRLLDRAFDQCLRAYKQQGERERLSALESVFEDFFHKVVQPIKGFVQFTEAQKKAIGSVPGIGGLPTASGGGYTAAALRGA